jgi:hypothetical protein
MARGTGNCTGTGAVARSASDSAIGWIPPLNLSEHAARLDAAQRESEERLEASNRYWSEQNKRSAAQLTEPQQVAFAAGCQRYGHSHFFLRRCETSGVVEIRWTGGGAHVIGQYTLTREGEPIDLCEVHVH